MPEKHQRLLEATQTMRAAEVPWGDRSYWQRILEIEQRSFSQPWRMEDFQLLAHDERALHVGLWRGSELTGYALGYVGAEKAELYLASLAVDEGHRRQGWGGFLLSEILTRAHARSCEVCNLEVRASNIAAQNLYQKFGFEVSGTQPRFYTDPVEDAVLMKCPLAPSVQPETTPAPEVALDG